MEPVRELLPVEARSMSSHLYSSTEKTEYFKKSGQCPVPPMKLVRELLSVEARAMSNRVGRIPIFLETRNVMVRKSSLRQV